jgi:hypothetical protein
MAIQGRGSRKGRSAQSYRQSRTMVRIGRPEGHTMVFLLFF